MLSPHSPIHNSTSARMQALAGDEAAILTSQEYEASRNLAGLTRPAHRRSKLVLCLVIHGRGDQRCPNRSRAHRIDPNAFANELIREASGESHNSALGGIEEGMNVVVEGLVPLFIAEVVDGVLHHLEGCIVDQDVDSSHLL
jgi:hypothetical protein